MCSGCGLNGYCDKECQMSDWPRHKLVCLSLRSIALDMPSTQSSVESIGSMGGDPQLFSIRKQQQQQYTKDEKRYGTMDMIAPTPKSQ
jgi:hypothetical protein